MQDKKKFIVLGVLALVIVAVGAFQFTAGSSAPASAASAKKEEKKKPAEAEAKEEPKNPYYATNLPARDPFEQTVLKDKPADMPSPQPTPVKNPVVDSAPVLPKVDIEKTGSFNGGISAGTAPVQITAVPVPKFSFTVSGVMLGTKPIAVFNDAEGNQRLVPEGGSLDPESKVLKISKDAVTVRFHGKTLRLTVEGNPNE